MFCCSSTICHTTHSLCVTVTFSLYLPLLVYNLFVAPMLLSCTNSFLLSSFCITISRSFSRSFSLSLSLSLHYGQSLCLFLSTIFISHYPFIILNAGKKLYWIFLFLMNFMKIIKWQNLILSLVAYEIQNHLMPTFKVIT